MSKDAAILAEKDARIAELEAMLLAKQAGVITFKVAANSGMISCYGFGVHPMNYYAEQIDRTFLDPEFIERIREFRNRPDVVPLLSFKLDTSAEKDAKLLARRASKAPHVQHPKKAA